MILKIHTRSDSSYGQALRYITNELKTLGLNLTSYITQNRDTPDGTPTPFLLKWNIKGDSIEEWVEQFAEAEQYRKYRRKDNIKLFHSILSFKKEDSKSLTSQKLKDFTRKYISLNNPRGQYVAVPHFDKEHWHVHVVFSAVDRTTGMSLSLRFNELTELKQNLQAYQIEKYPELKHSIVEHGKKEKDQERVLTDAEYHIKKRGHKTKKAQVIETIQEALDQASTTKEFIEKLNEVNMPIYGRGGKELYGVTFGAKNYRFSTLDFTNQIIELNKQTDRLQELQNIRKRSQSKELEQSKESPSVEDRLTAINELRETEQESPVPDGPAIPQSTTNIQLPEQDVTTTNDALQEISEDNPTPTSRPTILADSNNLRHNIDDGQVIER